MSASYCAERAIRLHAVKANKRRQNLSYVLIFAPGASAVLGYWGVAIALVVLLGVFYWADPFFKKFRDSSRWFFVYVVAHNIVSFTLAFAIYKAKPYSSGWFNLWLVLMLIFALIFGYFNKRLEVKVKQRTLK